MAKRRIIGIMTGNSMDAIDVVLTEFDNEKIRDICSLSIPYGISEKQKIDYLRKITVEQKIPAQELIKNAFFIETHKQYIEGVASAVNELCRRNNILFRVKQFVHTDPHCISRRRHQLH